MLEVYAVWDKKVESFLSPFFVKHTVEAIRSLTAVVKDPNTSLGRYPADYQLRHVGAFNEETGELIAQNHALGIIEISSLLETA